MARASSAPQMIRLPMPHAGQKIVLRQAKRFNHLCAGRRWRKTSLGLNIMVPPLLEAPGEYLWTAPTYKQVRIGWEEMKRAAAGVFSFNESRMELRTPTGSLLHFVTLDDPDNARGLTAKGLIMDEASEVPEYAWREVLRPMLMDTGGWAWMMYTPKGRVWTWREWTAAQDRDDSMAWQIPTLGAAIVDGGLVRTPHPLENPHISFDELRQMYETMPEATFRQEILAEFLDDGGGAFQGVDAVLTSERLKAPTRGADQYIMGVDLAKSQDYTVCAVMDLRTRRQVALERWNRCEWPLTKARIITLAKLWNNARVFLDATGLGDPIYDDLVRAQLRIEAYKITTTTRQPLLENLVLLIEQGRVGLLNDTTQTNELKAMERVRLPSGLFRFTTPEPLHDDTVFALALACLPLANDYRALPAEAVEQLRIPVSSLGGGGLYGRKF